MSDGAGASQGLAAGGALGQASQQAANQNTQAMMSQIPTQNLQQAAPTDMSGLTKPVGLPQSTILDKYGVTPDKVNAWGGFSDSQPNAISQAMQNIQKENPGLAGSADQGDKPWYNGILHGGGDGRMTDAEIDRTSRLSDLIGKTSDPTLKNQYQQQLNEIQAGVQDRGGIVGSMARIMSGKGQSGMEQMGTAGLTAAMPIIKALLAKNEMSKMTGRILANQNQVRANQQQWANSQFL